MAHIRLASLMYKENYLARNIRRKRAFSFVERTIAESLRRGNLWFKFTFHRNTDLSTFQEDIIKSLKDSEYIVWRIEDLESMCSVSKKDSRIKDAVKLLDSNEIIIITPQTTREEDYEESVPYENLFLSRQPW